jgi:hypothetical protein
VTLYSGLRLELFGSTNGTTSVGGTARGGVLSRDVWTWILVHRNNNNIRLFYDGVFQIAASPFNTGVAMYDFTAGIGIGAYTDGVIPAGTKTSMYIDELRIIKGLHPYPNNTSAITVPTAPYDI